MPRSLASSDRREYPVLHVRWHVVRARPDNVSAALGRAEADFGATRKRRCRDCEVFLGAGENYAIVALETAFHVFSLGSVDTLCKECAKARGLGGPESGRPGRRPGE